MIVLLSAYSCDPTKGSEPGNGWNWAIGLANKGYEVHCLTRKIQSKNIESYNKPDNLTFHFIELPMGIKKLYSFSKGLMYLNYLMWQWLAYKKAKSLYKQYNFSIIHHVTWGSLQMGSFLYKLNIPFIFGPAGGGQKAPKNYNSYFLSHWKNELKREKVSKILIKWNPGYYNMIRKARVVLVSNIDTLNTIKNSGVQKVELILDAALPSDFFPAEIPLKLANKKDFNLLWVGRFLPRKGIMLIIDIMAKLRNNQNIKLTVVGDGDMRKEFLEGITKYNLESTVNWVGKVNFDQVKEFYASHDAFLFTSLRDSCPAQLIEAMAYGLPVITLDLHGQSIIVDDSRGIKCDVSEPSICINKITDSIVRLSKERDFLKDLSLSAFEFAKEQTWDKKINYITEKYYY